MRDALEPLRVEPKTFILAILDNTVLPFIRTRAAGIVYIPFETAFRVYVKVIDEELDVCPFII